MIRLTYHYIDAPQMCLAINRPVHWPNIYHKSAKYINKTNHRCLVIAAHMYGTICSKDM